MTIQEFILSSIQRFQLKHLHSKSVFPTIGNVQEAIFIFVFFVDRTHGWTIREKYKQWVCIVGWITMEPVSYNTQPKHLLPHFSYQILWKVSINLKNFMHLYFCFGWFFGLFCWLKFHKWAVSIAKNLYDAFMVTLNLSNC